MKLSKEEIEYIQYFEDTTGARVKDCVMNTDTAFIIVEPGSMGAAIGKRGENVKKIKNKTKKDISIVEYSSDPKKFIQNLFAPAKLDSIELSETKMIVSSKEKNRLIGQKGNRIKRARVLMERYFGIKDIEIR
ncbi:MAG: NusA-like transcription termination signal-binding factor [Candidatus Diapherotrites archaeon]|nr:NusA-like transcription termination signal-binding factor [Candidatus Diapherotrites archaeon]